AGGQTGEGRSSAGGGGFADQDFDLCRSDYGLRRGWRGLGRERRSVRHIQIADGFGGRRLIRLGQFQHFILDRSGLRLGGDGPWFRRRLGRRLRRRGGFDRSVVFRDD